MFISGAVGPGDHEADKSSLWVVSIFGGALRRLRGDAFGAVISPDNSLVTFQSESGIWVAGSDGEAPREFLAEAAGENLVAQRWSWKGERIVYGRWVRNRNRRNFSIESRDLEGGSMTTLVSGRRFGNSFLMLEDRLVFVRNERFPRQRDQNLWEVAVNTATWQPLGEPRRLTDWTGFSFSNLSTTADGQQVAFRKNRWQSDVYVGEIEGGGRSLDAMRRLSLDDLSDWPSAWTPDSKTVIYTSNRNGTTDLFRQGLEQRTASVLVSGSRELFGARLTPDRASFLYWSIARVPDDAADEEDEPDDTRRLMRVPVSGGPTEEVLRTSNRASVLCGLVQDSGCLLIEHEPESGHETLYVLDPVKGKGDELLSRDFDRELDPDWDLSPDGKRLALVGDEEDDRSIRVLDLSGNLVEEIVLQGLPGATLFDIAWPASGRGFFVLADSPRGRILAFVEPTGEVHQFLQARSGGLSSLRPSPDGRRLAFGRGTTDSNVWIIENF